MALPEGVSREEWLEARVRGTEYLASAYGLLDLTAFGRSEDWEEPKGRARVLHGADPTFTD